jgi:hypothetical protein
LASHPNQDPWPELDYPSWKDTLHGLHMRTQIVGKIRLVRMPWVNHSWHVPLYVTARGLTTWPMPDGARQFQIDFDFCDHTVKLQTSDRLHREIALRPQSVADFHDELMATLGELGITVKINGVPNEVAEAIPFREDRAPRPYDADYANRFWRVLVQADRLFTRFRAGFIGKCSPVHFFWGSFDLAVTRFSGRTAPRHPGGVPHLPDAVTRDAYSHEVSSAGFWPGGGAIDYAAFYSYAYPTPEGFNARPIEPEAAFFHEGLGEFLLPYDAVRTASDPDDTLMRFLETTYAAAAETAHWDRAALERTPVPPTD